MHFKICFNTNEKSSGYGHIRFISPAVFAMDAQTLVDCVMLLYWHLGQRNNREKTENARIGRISWAASVSLSGLSVRARSDFFPDWLVFQNELTEAAESLLHLFFLWYSKMPVLIQIAISSYLSEYSPPVSAHFLSWAICLVFTYWIMTMDYLTHFSPYWIPFNDFFFFFPVRYYLQSVLCCTSVLWYL